MKLSQRRNNKNALFLTSISLFLLACTGGDGSGLPATLPPGAFGPNFSEIQANVFTPTCATTGCHLGAGAPQGLRLDVANSYGLLVDVPSSQASSVLRVATGDPNNSYLVQKLEGTASVGAQMPLNASPVEQASIDVIRQWISDGAIDDRVASFKPIRVTSLSPVPDSVLTATPLRIVAMFDRELDVSTINWMTFVLEASGGDGMFTEGNETSITAANISATATTATFDLTGVALADDTYRVRLFGSGPSVIMDLDANALAGGDYEAIFSLTDAVNTATQDE